MTHEGGALSKKNSLFLCWALFVLFYVILVHVADIWATYGRTWPFDWRIFRWVVGGGKYIYIRHNKGVFIYPLLGFDIFKFVAWFLLPFLFAIPHLDWGYFGIKRLTKVDYFLLGAIILIGLLVVLTVVIVPGLRGYYPSLRYASPEDKFRVFYHTVIYIFSWLVGWEFLHRYILLVSWCNFSPRFGWLIVPVVEGGYHFVKHPLEMVGMIIFSFLGSFWTLKKQCIIPAFLAHLCIEIELLLVMLFV